ncbi:MAG: DUF3880 domain-containing protein [Lachnospiraceae bacterium]|nr:DUF3880 domain-containing protein [Lachnospiraceae bacterium]
MKILYFKWNSFGTEDIEEALAELGHDLVIVPYDRDDVKVEDTLVGRLIESIDKEKPDIVFTSNYYPPVSEAAHEKGIRYVSWVYDSPHVALYSYTTMYETNTIYVFDREVCDEFNKNKINTVSYLPLAANPKRLRTLIEDKAGQDLFIKSRFYNKADIAFVGAMYDEDHTFFRRLTGITDYTRGYLEGIIATQRQVFGYNFVKSLLRDDIMDDMSRDLPMQPGEGSVASREYLFSEYCINREITARERMDYISAIGKIFSKDGRPGLDLYTGNKDLKIDGVYNHGPIDHYATAPYVYDKAKININITLRSIHSGIPLRAFEILGSGGFLLSNYQGDFADCYVDGEDYVSFSGMEDMLLKIEYYLSHENERKEIAANGLARTLKMHTYVERLRQVV